MSPPASKSAQALTARRGDLEGLMASVADDVVIVEPSFLPYGGEYRGKEGMAAVFGEVAKVLDPAGMSLEHLVAGGDTVYAKIRVPAALCFTT